MFEVGFILGDQALLVLAGLGPEGITAVDLTAYAASIAVDATVMMAEGTMQIAATAAQVNSGASFGPGAVQVGSVGPTGAPTAAPQP